MRNPDALPYWLRSRRREKMREFLTTVWSIVIVWLLIMGVIWLVTNWSTVEAWEWR